jgi:PAS domain-containing protein
MTAPWGATNRVTTSRSDSLPCGASGQAAWILESAVTAIITIDDRGLIEDINPATERLFGRDATELLEPNDVNMLMPEPDRCEHDG